MDESPEPRLECRFFWEAPQNAERVDKEETDKVLDFPGGNKSGK